VGPRRLAGDDQRARACRAFAGLRTTRARTPPRLRCRQECVLFLCIAGFRDCALRLVPPGRAERPGPSGDDRGRICGRRAAARRRSRGRPAVSGMDGAPFWTRSGLSQPGLGPGPPLAFRPGGAACPLPRVLPGFLAATPLSQGRVRFWSRRVAMGWRSVVASSRWSRGGWRLGGSWASRSRESCGARGSAGGLAVTGRGRKSLDPRRGYHRYGKGSPFASP